MSVSMTAPMVVWMRHRGHAWARAAEMATAMLVPAIALVALLPSGAIDGEALVQMQHGAIIPSMLAVMLVRRRDYA